MACLTLEIKASYMPINILSGFDSLRSPAGSIALAALFSITALGLGMTANAQVAETFNANDRVNVVDASAPQNINDNLRQVIASSYKHHPELKSLRAQTEASKEGLVQARGSYFPQINLQGSIFQSSRDGVLQVGSSFSQDTTPKSLSLNLSQTLYNGGRRKLAKRNALYVSQASQAQFADSATQIAAEIIQDYMLLYSSQKELDVRLETVATLEKLEAIVTARREIGDAISTEVSQARSQLIGAQAQVASTRADIENMKEVLLSKSGQFVQMPILPPEAIVDITHDLEYMKRMARQESAALKASELNMLSSQVSVASEKRKHLPTVTLEANASSSRDISPTILEDDDLNIGVSFSMPIYTAGIGASQTRQALSLYNAARFEHENAGRLIDSQVTQRWAQLQSNRFVIDAQRASVAASQEALTGAIQSQEAGISSSQDILDAVRNKLVADLELLTTEYEQYTIRLLLKLLIGEFDVYDFN